MAVSGTFKTSARYVGYRPAADNSKNWGVGVDPDHGRSDLQDAGFPAPSPPALYQSVPAYLEDYFDPGADNLPYLAPYEHEPAGHDVPSPPSGYVRDDQAQAQAGAARMVGLGANTSRNRPTGQRQHDEVHRTEMRRSLPPQRGEPTTLTGQALRALRGRNSLAVNNPGSPEVNGSGNYVRQGQEIVRWSNRKMWRRDLTHTKRILHLNVADSARDSAGTRSPYSSPFASLPNMAKGTSVPYQRRQPRPWDEDVIVDGVDSGEQIVSWGL